MQKDCLETPTGAPSHRRSAHHRGIVAAFVAVAIGATGCSVDLGQFTVKSTAKVMRRAQPSIKMESDYEMAARAIPGSLKTVEGFWIVKPDDENLIAILTEGYCQYGTAFVEDEWERAVFAKDLPTAEYHNTRATKMFTRCLNYALIDLGKKWQDNLFGAPDVVEPLVAKASSSRRTPLMWAAFALGSIINHNLSNIDVISNLSTVKLMLAKVVEMDTKHPPSDPVLRALPHVALGMLYSATSKQLGGDPDKAQEEFNLALTLTADKDGNERYLLPRVMMAYRVGKQTQNREFFHTNLVKVLETAPSVWPEQRLANEVAHRRARRYLALEKEIFQ